MADFNVGDVITFRLRGDRYGVATVLLVEDLSFHTNYHVVIHDAVIEGSEGGLDEFGDPFDRQHEASDIDTSSVAIDHLGVTQHGLQESEPMVVGEREPADEELSGYRIWLAAARRAAAERGLFARTRPAAGSRINEEAVPEEGASEEVEADEISAPQEEAVSEGLDAVADDGVDSLPGDDPEDMMEGGEDDDGTELGDADAEVTDEEILAGADVRPWHLRLFDRSIGAALFEMHEAMTASPVSQTALGSYIASFYDGSKSEEISDLVDRLVDGDYGAGQELLDYGDPAAGHLRDRLADLREPEVVADVLQILADMGTDTAYTALSEYFAAHHDVDGDHLAIPAVRAYAYAVMLTGGSPEPLAGGLERLAAIDHPELNGDIASAMTAVRELEAGTVGEATTKETSSSPFGTLGV